MKCIPMKKLVKESLTDVLKPKTEDEIRKELDPLLQDFVNRVSVAEFEEYFLENITTARKLKTSDGYVIPTTEDEITDAIDHFLGDISTVDMHGPVDYEVSMRFPKLNQLLYQRFQGNGETYWQIIEKLNQMFADKFHLEY